MSLVKDTMEAALWGSNLCLSCQALHLEEAAVKRWQHGDYHQLFVECSYASGAREGGQIGLNPV